MKLGQRPKRLWIYRQPSNRNRKIIKSLKKNKYKTQPKKKIKIKLNETNKYKELWCNIIILFFSFFLLFCHYLCVVLRRLVCDFYNCCKHCHLFYFLVRVLICIWDAAKRLIRIVSGTVVAFILNAFAAFFLVSKMAVFASNIFVWLSTVHLSVSTDCLVC